MTWTRVVAGEVMTSGNFLKYSPDFLNTGGHKRKKGVKNDSMVITQATGRMDLPFTDMSPPAGTAEGSKAMVFEVISLRGFLRH